MVKNCEILFKNNPKLIPDEFDHHPQHQHVKNDVVDLAVGGAYGCCGGGEGAVGEGREDGREGDGGDVDAEGHGDQ